MIDAGKEAYEASGHDPDWPWERLTPREQAGWERAGHEQRADHYQYLYEQASEGKCGYSGLTLGACKASICDCFEFPWVKPAPEQHPLNNPTAQGDRGNEGATE